MSGYVPDRATYEKAVSVTLEPQRVANSLAFMFESRWAIRPTMWALAAPIAQQDYDDCWSSFAKARLE